VPILNGRFPKYRLHRNSGQGIVTLNGRDHYLGLYGSDESKASYDRLIAQWLSQGRQTHSPAPPVTSKSPKSLVPQSAQLETGPTVNQVIHGFWQHAKIHYRKPDGTPARELDNFRPALRPLRRLYGPSPAGKFGPMSLKALREHMIGLDWCRSHINKQISRIKSVFRWAVENELVPTSVHYGLSAVKGLQRGRTDAREAKAVRPVAENLIAAIQPFVSREVWSLIQLQLLTGARPGELVLLRGVDLKTADLIWTVEPETHKTAHHGHSKCIYFGPQAKMILQPFLQSRPLGTFLFSPAEAEAERREKRHKARVTPMSCGNRPGTNRRKSPRRHAADRYTVSSYRQAIWRACDHAFPPPLHLAREKVKAIRGRRWETITEWKSRLGAEYWAELKTWRADHRWHPHQLRHNAATRIRKEFGIEMARIILGHRSASVTEIYAEVDDEKAKSIMKRIG
jgi:integrase